MRKYDDVLAAVEPARRHDRLCELNVIEQVNNVCQTTVVQDAWARSQRVVVHGFVYSLDDGLLRSLSASIDDPSKVAETLRDATRALPER
jgi:carbonic anhydrase